MSPSASQDSAVPAQTDWRWATVVVVDDDETCRMLLQAMVKRFGVGRIIEAVDGIDCLDKIIGVVPDLIISDVSMPRMDGVELCHHIRSLSEFADVPILIQTGSVGIEKHLSCFNAGASDVLAKPLRPSELRARMRVHLENRRLVYNLRKADQRITRELEGARRMQTALMPKPQRIQDIRNKYGVIIEGVVNPSFSIGGDFWGIIDIDDYAFGIYTVDFSGHGVMSALNTFRFHAVISEITANHKDPAAFLGVLNEALVGVLPRGQYATFFYAVIDTLRCTITWSGAGAPFPILIRKNIPTYLDTTGTPLGLVKDSIYSNAMLLFPQGSGLFVYSDGMIDCTTKEGDEFGEVKDFIAAELVPQRKISLDLILSKFYERAAIPLQDDLTAIWVENEGGVRRFMSWDDNDERTESQIVEEILDHDGMQVPVLLIDGTDAASLTKALRQCTAVIETGDGDFHVGLDDVKAVRDGAIMLSMTTKSAYGKSPCCLICDVLEERGWLLANQHEDVLLALQEAMANSVIHGNLEMKSPSGGGTLIRQYWIDLRERLENPQYHRRRITLLAWMDETTLIVSLEDQGPGFSKDSVGPCDDHASSGRGKSLMTTLASRVDWSKGGRKVILTFALSDAYA